jgi:hypothetical protein
LDAFAEQSYAEDGRAVIGMQRRMEVPFSFQASTLFKQVPQLRFVWWGKCVTSYDGYQIPLSAEMDGSWALAVDTTAQGTKLGGFAVLTLSNGRTFTYQISGTYDERRQRGVLRLVGTNEAVKSRVTLWVEGNELVLTKVTGRILGQSLSFP